MARRWPLLCLLLLAPSFTGLRRPSPARTALRAYTVLVPIAEGSEEIETACVTDVLTRAGAEVTVASCAKGLEVRMSRGLKARREEVERGSVSKGWGPQEV